MVKWTANYARVDGIDDVSAHIFLIWRLEVLNT